MTNFYVLQMIICCTTIKQTQSKSIMELENEVAVLGGKYLLEKEKVEVQSAANVELTLKLREQSDKVEAKANEIVTLQSQVNSLERKLQKDKEIINEQVEKFNSEVNKMKKEIKIESMRHIEAERLRFTKEINKYKANNNQGDLELEQLKEEVDRYKNRALAFKDMNDFKRPLQDNQTQTIVDDNGLWDKQDGWKELPISKTRLARHHWREAINFTTCKACRGIGNYIYQVGAILKDITRGETMINDEIITDDFCKWSLPDELVRFLSNLPKTIQATNPKSINWLMKRVLVIFELKYHADDDDRKLGYNLQPLTEYIIEIFLLRYKSRTEAEFELYYLIDTLKEHYDKHPLLQLFARFLNILGTLPIEEKRRLKKQQKANENLLKKKKKNDMNVLKARERNKIMYARTQEEIASRKKNPQDAQNGSSVLPYENGFLGKEELLKISSKSLTLEISEIFLFARQLIFYSYSGVYAEKIKAIKETSELLQQKEQSLYNDKDWQLHGKLPEHFCIGIRNSFYIPMDRAIAVIKPFINFLPSETIIKVYHSIESSAVQLLSEGELLLTDGKSTTTTFAIKFAFIILH